jgi:cell wall-associated NlpC family hydrolase
MAHPAAERGSATVALTAAAALLLLITVLIGAVAGVTSQQASACSAQPAPAAGATAAIPASYLALFEKAGTAYGIPWPVLADFGADDGPSSAGALGPMQFEPSTWAEFGDGGNIMDPADAIPAAARLLVANGAPGDLSQAIFAYNHASWYVDEVLAQAARYADGGAQAITATASAECQQAALGPLPAGSAGKILAYAAAQLGKPYVFGEAGPDAFDCSGLAMMAYRAAGITIPRTSQAQWAYGRQVPAGLRAGGRRVRARLPGLSRGRRDGPAPRRSRRADGGHERPRHPELPPRRPGRAPAPGRRVARAARQAGDRRSVHPRGAHGNQ